MAFYQVTEHLNSKPQVLDLFSNLPSEPSKKHPVPMTIPEMTAECTTMIDAGNDTTQTTLTNCLYQLANNPKKQAKNFAEFSNKLCQRKASPSLRMPS
jgi:benzoate 4-monooxygenase